MSRLTRDGQTCLAKPSYQARTGTRKCFPVQLTMNRIGNLPVDLYSAICDDNTCVHLYCCRVYPQLPLAIGAPRGCCGHASGISFPRPSWFGGCSTHATPCSVSGYSYCTSCLERSERNSLTGYRYNAAILVSFYFIRVFKGVLSSELVDQEQKIGTVTSKKSRLEASKPPT